MLVSVGRERNSAVQGGCRAGRHGFQRPERRKREEDGAEGDDGATQTQRRPEADDFTLQPRDEDAREACNRTQEFGA